MRSLRVTAALLCCVLLVACQGEGQEAGDRGPDGAGGAADVDAPAAEPEDDDGAGEPDVDPADVGANELGEVPVLMYHRILDDGGGEFDLTPDQFRAELERLYAEDYRPIRTVDLVRGEIDVPAGTTPVVLTFDDSTREQFAYTDDGEIEPDTAVGILLDFADERPDFEAVGSFYVNIGPFGGGADSDDILVELHELGFELGNHTLRHARLDRLGDDEVRQELALGARVITDVVPDAEVTTMSLPLGLWPEPRDLVYEGEHEGDRYEHEGVLLVGAHPAPSPFDDDFDPLAIPRILANPDGEDFTSRYWLDTFAEAPERRFVSDGDPGTISFPEARADDLDERHADRANPY
jgi:hypothetical protein